MLLGLNFGALLAAACAYLAIGTLWYAPFCWGKIWAKLQPSKLQGKERMAAYLGNFVMALIIAVILGILQLSVYGFNKFMVALMVGVIVAAIKAGNYFFEDRPLQLYLINVGHPILSLLVMGFILAGWG